MDDAAVDDESTGEDRSGEPVDHGRSMTPLASGLGWTRRKLTTPPSSEARDAIDELVPDGDELAPYVGKFVVLTLLSAGIAAFGLLADSGAVVIGAMLVAPLMTPITATAAATVMAHNVRLVRALLIILLGTGLAIAVGYVTTLLAGVHVVTGDDLPQEIASRTYPGLLDLGIAITAGAAAGYIAPRRSVTSALPGVGIAVALVPPLATVGITARVGLTEDALNALLLFLTNLAAIVFSASVMLLLSGFRPDDHLRHRLRRRLAVTVLAVVAVAVPLTIHTAETLRDARLERIVSQSVEAWDDSAEVRQVDSDVDHGHARVELLVSSPDDPRPAQDLADEIRRRFGGPVDLRLLVQRDQEFVVEAP